MLNTTFKQLVATQLPFDVHFISGISRMYALNGSLCMYIQISPYQDNTRGGNSYIYYLLMINLIWYLKYNFNLFVYFSDFGPWINLLPD